MNIRGIYKTSLIDFPGRICTVLFSGGCNLRCRFCHNPDLACNRSSLERSSNEQALELLHRRKNIIDAVTLSGGEPTLSSNIEAFIELVREIPLLVKLDTNGLQPGVIGRLVSRGLLDYVAVDIKTSPEKYAELSASEVDFSAIRETVDILRGSGIAYELRTTCVPGFSDFQDYEAIRDAIGPVRAYYLQQFIPNVPLLDESLKSIRPLSAQELYALRDFVRTFSEICEVRGL